jgi:hypothetical protein
MQVKNTVVAAIFAVGVTALPQAEPTATCNRDNCFRQLIQKPELVGPFCATYTKTVNTASTALPTFVSNCQGLASRVSSACSCLHPATTTSVSTTTPPVTTNSATTSASPTTTIVPIVDGWVNFTTVGGYFLQDELSTEPSSFDYVGDYLLLLNSKELIVIDQMEFRITEPNIPGRKCIRRITYAVAKIRQASQELERTEWSKC